MAQSGELFFYHYITSKSNDAQADMLPDNELARKNIDAIRLKIRDQIGGYVVATKNIEAQEILFRGVRLKSAEAIPTQIRRVSYPPSSEVSIQEGRLNRENQSMFYCSKSAAGLFYELRAKPGEIFVISRWETKESLWAHNLGYDISVLKQLGAHANSISRRQILTNPFLQETKKNRKIRRRLSKAFAIDVPEDKKYRYRQSIAITELFLCDSSIPYQPGGPTINKAAGIVYPAMQLHGDADNLALLPEIVESSLQIKEALCVKVEAADEKRSSYVFLTQASANTFSDGTIIWTDITDRPEIDRRSSIELEDNRWVQKDGYGVPYTLSKK